jgi:hypothetical protein
LAQAIFEPKYFLYDYPNLFSNLVVLHLPAHEDGTECSETSEYKIQVTGNYPEENIQLCTEEKRGTTFRSSTDEIFETSTWNNKTRLKKPMY